MEIKADQSLSSREQSLKSYRAQITDPLPTSFKKSFRASGTLPEDTPEEKKPEMKEEPPAPLPQENYLHDHNVLPPDVILASLSPILQERNQIAMSRSSLVTLTSAIACLSVLFFIIGLSTGYMWFSTGSPAPRVLAEVPQASPLQGPIIPEESAALQKATASLPTPSQKETAPVSAWESSVKSVEAAISQANTTTEAVTSSITNASAAAGKVVEALEDSAKIDRASTSPLQEGANAIASAVEGARHTAQEVVEKVSQEVTMPLAQAQTQAQTLGQSVTGLATTGVQALPGMAQALPPAQPLQKAGITPPQREMNVYSLELAKVNDQAVAQDMASLFQKRGMPNFIVQSTDDSGRPVFHIRSGQFGSYNEAHTASEKFFMENNVAATVARFESDAAIIPQS